MNNANPKVVKVVKLKVSEYILETMRDRNISLGELSDASDIGTETIKIILEAGENNFVGLLADLQVLRIHMMFEISSTLLVREYFLTEPSLPFLSLLLRRI
jgi:hypothetical protein